MATKPNEISDIDVLDKIELPELADDDFFSSSTCTPSHNTYSEDLFAPEEPLVKESPKAVLHYDKKKIAHEIGLDVESFNELFERLSR